MLLGMGSRVLVRFLGRLYVGMLCALLAVIASLIGAGVVFRYGFNDPLLYAAELATLLFVWLVFLGIPFAAYQGAHMNADLMEPFLRDRGRKWSRVLSLLLSALLVGYLCFVSWDLTQRAVMELPTLGMSVAWVYAAAPVGLGLYLGYLVLALLGFVHRDDRPGSTDLPVDPATGAFQTPRGD
jgi:TRAP-type C4-dicarboxylate transport system permease small subunit